MESITLTEIRASEIARWLDCPQKGLHKHMQPKRVIEDTAHVGTVVGDLVHEKLTGHSPTLQRQIIYDQITRNEYEMSKQTKHIVKAIKQFVDRRGWSIVSTEIPLRVRLSVAKSMNVTITGTIDAIAVDEDGNYYLIDYKTGKEYPYKVMSQIAVYAWLYHTKKAEHSDRIHKVGAVFMERKRLGVESQFDLPMSWGVNYQDAVKYGKEIVYHTAKMACGVVNPYFNPSKFHCLDCEKACNFRIGDDISSL